MRKFQLKQVDPLFYDEFPGVRAKCIGVKDFCAWVRCRHHMIWGYGTIADRRHTVLKKSDDKIVNMLENMKNHCALDLADIGDMTLNEAAKNLGNITRERVRQVEAKALRRVRNKKENVSHVRPRWEELRHYHQED